jgi:sporulation integral membrane protein YtvI
MYQLSPKTVAVTVVIGALLWLTGRFLLPVLLPFLLALVLALAAEPVVRVFRNRLHLPAWAASGIGVTAALLVALLSVASLCAFLVRQLGQLASILPDLEDTARQGMASLEGFLRNAAHKAPANVSSVLERGVESLFSDGSTLLEDASGGILRLASGVVTRIPDSALGVGTFLSAAFILSSRLPQLRHLARQRLPQSWQEKYLPAVKRLKKAFSGWLFAQLKLTAVTFSLLLVGFLLLRIRHGILWAALVSLLDALPVLGTGMILVPWSLVCFLQGDPVRGLGLLGTYAAAAVLSSILEPKLVGRQLGLDPLVTLLALYAGYRLWGLAGMILAPLLAVMAAYLLRAGKDA